MFILTRKPLIYKSFKPYIWKYVRKGDKKIKLTNIKNKIFKVHYTPALNIMKRKLCDSKLGV